MAKSDFMDTTDDGSTKWKNYERDGLWSASISVKVGCGRGRRPRLQFAPSRTSGAGLFLWSRGILPRIFRGGAGSPASISDFPTREKKGKGNFQALEQRVA